MAGHNVGGDQAAVRASLGIVTQQPCLDLNLTAEENLRLHAILYGLYPWRPSHRWMPTAYRSQVQDLAAVLGVADVLGQKLRSLSGGTRRKLEIVRALMHRPSILVLDEPTAGLDPEARRSLWHHLGEARGELGTTILLTTHYLHEAEPAQRVCVMWKGRILADAAPADLKGGGVEMWVDAPDRRRLSRALEEIGCSPVGQGPFVVRLDGRSAQDVIRRIDLELSVLRVTEPTLEEAYLQLLEQARN